jgi:hypothetical protein
MRGWWLSTLVALVLAQGRGAAESPRWLTDYEEAKKLAQRQRKPLFVVFRCEH